MKRKLCVLCVLCGDIVFFIPEGAETFILATEVTEGAEVQGPKFEMTETKEIM